jgi:hypothetical protein
MTWNASFALRPALPVALALIEVLKLELPAPENLLCLCGQGRLPPLTGPLGPPGADL